MFCQLVSIQLNQKIPNHACTNYQGVTMGYLISFLLGIFVATVGVSGTASALDKAVKTAQIYMKESVK